MAQSASAEVNIVVTGFSPWGSYAPLPNLPINTSWQIAKSLPRVIFRANKPNVRVLTYPTPIKTSWETARKSVPVLWEGNKKDYGLYIGPTEPATFEIDAMIHLDMDDDTDSPFSLEKKAYKTGFKDPDVDNKTPSGDDLDGGGSWKSCPEVLETAFDVEVIWTQVVAHNKNLNIRTSTDPGRYLCAYLYYASLAAREISGGVKRLLFVHVPPKHQSEDIEAGVGVLTKILEAVADQLPISDDVDESKL